MDRKRDPRGIPSGGEFATESKAESDVSLAAPAESVWVRIEREHGDDLVVGPYPDEESAGKALEEAPLIEGFCEEDCLDAYVDTGQPTSSDEQVIISLEDAAFTESLESLDSRYGLSMSDEDARAGLRETSDVVESVLEQAYVYGLPVGQEDRDTFDHISGVDESASREDVIAAYDQALTLASSLTGRERYSPEQRTWARH